MEAYLCAAKKQIMSLMIVGSMAFDALETPFGKVDRIIGGSATYAAWAASNFTQPIKQVSIVGGDFPQEELDTFIINQKQKLSVNLENSEKKRDNPRTPGRDDARIAGSRLS